MPAHWPAWPFSGCERGVGLVYAVCTVGGAFTRSQPSAPGATRTVAPQARYTIAKRSAGSHFDTRRQLGVYDGCAEFAEDGVDVDCVSPVLLHSVPASPLLPPAP